MSWHGNGAMPFPASPFEPEEMPKLSSSTPHGLCKNMGLICALAFLHGTLKTLDTEMGELCPVPSPRGRSTQRHMVRPIIAQCHATAPPPGSESTPLPGWDATGHTSCSMIILSP